MKKNILIALSIFLGAQVVRATGGSGTGNGGDGIIIDQQIYLLDLVEGGVDESATFDNSLRGQPITQEIRDRLRKKIAFISDDGLDLLSLKLAELWRKSPYLGSFLVSGIELLDWVSVRSPLMPINDEESVIAVPANEIVQLAGRVDNIVRTDREYWKRLDAITEAATVLHEVLYASVKPEKDCLTSKSQNTNETAACLLHQSSRKAKDLNAILFSPAFSSMSYNEVWNRFAAADIATPEGDRSWDSSSFQNIVLVPNQSVWGPTYQKWFSLSLEFNSAQNSLGGQEGGACGPRSGRDCPWLENDALSIEFATPVPIENQVEVKNKIQQICSKELDQIRTSRESQDVRVIVQTADQGNHSRIQLKRFKPGHVFLYVYTLSSSHDSKRIELDYSKLLNAHLNADSAKCTRNVKAAVENISAR